MDGLLVINGIRVDAANAIAGLTWGFPAITNFLGFTHALQRNLPEALKIEFIGCGVVCHHYQVLAYQPSEYSDYSLALSRNPLDKSGKSASIVEEGRVNFYASLVIPLVDHVEGCMSDEEIETLKAHLHLQVQKQRLAGGVIVNEPEIKYINQEKMVTDHRRIMRDLLPGFVLVNRHDLLQQKQSEFREQGMENPELRAWMSFSSITHRAEQDEENNNEVTWVREDKKGWIVPITVGYRAISPLYANGEIAKMRDSSTPARFVENLYSLGQWLSPHRISRVEDMIWKYQYSETDDYLCVNNFNA